MPTPRRSAGKPTGGSPRPSAGPATPTPSKKRPSGTRPSAGAASADASPAQPRPSKAARAEDKPATPAAAPRPSAVAASTHATPKPVLAATIFVGSYHNVAVAFNLRKVAIVPRFTARSHVGSVVDVTACSKFLASSGSDESIAVQGVREHGAKFVDLGRVAPPSQANAIVFPDTRFMACGMEDGTVIVYRTRDWMCAAQIKAHDRAVTSVACHPSGALAVSVGRDNLVCVIDLARAAVIARRKLDKSLGAPLAVRFSPTGSSFVVNTQYSVSVFDTITATEIARSSFERDPPNEIQALAITSPAFVDAKLGPDAFTAIMSVEAGDLHYCTFDPAAAAAAPAPAEDTTAAGGKAPAKLARPALERVALSLRGDLPTLATSMVSEETGEAVEMRPRIRAITVVEGTLFAATSQGLIQVLDLASAPAATAGGPAVLAAKERVRHSAGGRITSIAVLKRQMAPGGAAA